MEQNEAIEYQTKEFPIDSLWGKETLVVPQAGYAYAGADTTGSNYLSSSIILIITILITLSFQNIVKILPLIIKAVFRYGYHIKIEDKLTLIRQRNILVLVSAICLCLLTILFAGDYISEQSGFSIFIVTVCMLFALLVYWMFKTAILRLFSWAAKEKKGFLMVGKIGYNYFILLFFLTIPLFLLSIIPHFISLETLINSLLILSLFVYVVYLVRTFQTINLARFSHFFYILYLCAAELLPLLLIIKLISGV
jgi:hypothetical protein